MAEDQYIVLCGQIVGGGHRAFETVYSYDGKRFDDRQDAILHGLEIRGSDDFNIATVRDGRIARIGWMDEDHDVDPDEIADLNRQVRP